MQERNPRILGRRNGYSQRQPSLGDVEYGAGGAVPEVNGDERMNPQPRVCAALPDRGQIVGGLEHDGLSQGRAMSPWIPRLSLVSPLWPTKLADKGPVE